MKDVGEAALILGTKIICSHDRVGHYINISALKKERKKKDLHYHLGERVDEKSIVMIECSIKSHR